MALAMSLVSSRLTFAHTWITRIRAIAPCKPLCAPLPTLGRRRGGMAERMCSKVRFLSGPAYSHVGLARLFAALVWHRPDCRRYVSAGEFAF